MGAQERIAAVQAAAAQLESAVHALRQEWGDTLGVRRLASDVRRIADDLDEIGEPLPGLPRRAAQLEVIPDTPYDRSMWEDADDEGFGAPDRHAP